MDSDVKINIVKLEEKIGYELKQCSLSDMANQVGYALDDNQKICGLTIWNTTINDISDLVLFPALTYLNVSRNRIEDIGPLSSLSALTFLDLGGNDIRDISPLRNLNYLVELHLWSNRIVDISPIAHLTSLKTLVLKGNEIMETNHLNPLGELKFLDLSGNNIRYIEQLNSCSTLTSLSLSNNWIGNIDTLASLSKLTNLNLDNNQIRNVEPLIKLRALRNLRLDGNCIKDIKPLSALLNLSSLNLSQNQIEGIAPLSPLKDLKQLYLKDNQIQDINAVSFLSNLNALVLSDNKVKNISPLGHLIKLRVLYLDNNSIHDLEPLSNLLGLTTLSLSHNEIEDIGPLAPLTGLTGLFLNNNPILFPPPEITEKGMSAIVSWLEDAQQQRCLNEVKVILVGDGAAGKTSLVKRFLGQGFDEREEQTHGINIQPWSYKHNSENVAVRFWDFGGQEIMHATHQFFLSKRGLYLLVLDGRRDERTEYWLKHVENFGGESPVMVVLNKIDENPSHEANRKYLMARYPAIQSFHRVSCKTGKGIGELKTALINNLHDLELRATVWPEPWFQVKKALESNDLSYMNHDSFEQICRQSGITKKENQSMLVHFLNDLGIAIHFDVFHLKDCYILEPKWLTNGVYAIVNSDELAEGNGILPVSIIPDLLSRVGDRIQDKKWFGVFSQFSLGHRKEKFSYPPAACIFIVELMRKFELCYEFEDRQYLLVPDLLAQEEPEFEWDYDDQIDFRINYKFLPRTVIPRLMVKRRWEIEAKLRWRNGVVLCWEQGARAVIRANYDERQINIHVVGHSKNQYLAKLRDSLFEINNSFQRNEITEEVACPCTECRIGNPYYYELEPMVASLLKGLEKVLCNKTANIVYVRDILAVVLGSEITRLEEKLNEIRQKHQTSSQITYSEITNGLSAVTNLGTALINFVVKLFS